MRNKILIHLASFYQLNKLPRILLSRGVNEGTSGIAEPTYCPLNIKMTVARLRGGTPISQDSTHLSIANPTCRLLLRRHRGRLMQLFPLGGSIRNLEGKVMEMNS
jgi:hypothetical protein